jgi:hypothetical protein
MMITDWNMAHINRNTGYSFNTLYDTGSPTKLLRPVENSKTDIYSSTMKRRKDVDGMTTLLCTGSLA